MWVGFANAKATHFFFSKNISIYAIFNDQSFNDTLTNNIVSFKQLGPDSMDTIEYFSGELMPRWDCVHNYADDRNHRFCAGSNALLSTLSAFIANIVFISELHKLTSYWTQQPDRCALIQSQWC